MNYYTIKSCQTGHALFAGMFTNFRECLEQAVSRGIDLSYADLSKKDLSNASLDGALLNQADFSFSNLTGANLSEAALQKTRFRHADLYNSCFAEAGLQYCDFRDANFGGTSIQGCDISYSHFSTLSAFALNFKDTRAMAGCRFHSFQRNSHAMTRPPLVIYGLHNLPVARLDHVTLLGHRVLSKSHLHEYTREKTLA